MNIYSGGGNLSNIIIVYRKGKHVIATPGCTSYVLTGTTVIRDPRISPEMEI